jgi:hypothetical protein
MLTTGLNALALMRIGGLHGGSRDGFGLLLMGLVAIGVVIWALSRPHPNENERAKT